MTRIGRILFFAASVLLATSGQGRAGLLLSKKEALARAFPAGVEPVKENAFLSKEDAAALRKSARVAVDSRLWTYYVGKSSAGVAGYAYFDRIVVRTMPATIMAAVSPEGELRFLEVLSFDEPRDYLPIERWLKLFEGERDLEKIRIGRKIRNVSGATLTSHALTDSARRLLGLHNLLNGKEKEEK
jgi:hypothetical protein